MSIHAQTQDQPYNSPSNLSVVQWDSNLQPKDGPKALSQEHRQTHCATQAAIKDKAKICKVFIWEHLPISFERD